MTEAERKTAVLQDLGRGETRVFNNPVGLGWTCSKAVHLPNGDVLLKNPRPVKFGLMVGSGDIIGWRSVIITPDMVGSRFARFLSIEMKSATGRPREGQPEWAAAVRTAGGLAGTARTVDQARLIAGLPVPVTA